MRAKANLFKLARLLSLKTIQAGERKRYGLAILAGLLSAAAFPRFGMAGLAWLGPGLLLMAGLGTSGWVALRIGYIGGLAFYLAALYWILLIPISFAPILGWVSLAAYLSLYPALWVWLCWRVFPVARDSGTNPPERASQVGSPPERSAALSRDAATVDKRSTFRDAPILELAASFLSVSWLRRLGWLFFCAALWVGLEMIVGRLFTGFPWLILGVTQYRILPLIQIASLTGVYGVSWLLVWFSVSLGSAMIMLIRRPESRWLCQRELLLPFLAAALAFLWGWRDLTQPTPERPTVKVALVQPSIPQTWIWDPTENSNRFQQLLQLTDTALKAQPQLLVWPEAAVPYMLRFDEEMYDAVTNLVREHHIWLVLGSDDAEVRLASDGRFETNFFNSSFLINPQGELAGTYRKRRLVIFGEYIPLARRFHFIEDLTGMGSFTPGEAPAIFSMPELGVRAAMLICFEDVFPHLTRTSMDDDTDFLLNLTNNGWFGKSAAQWQHAAASVFRAIENHRPLVRCANNGLSCWVDSQGGMHDVYFPGTNDIYGVGYKIVQIPLPGKQKPAPTFYHRHGDVFGWSCLGLSAFVFLVHWQVTRRKK